MKQYPSISSDLIKDCHFWVFPKYDGSNIRAEWNPKKGFYKFGSRKKLIDEKHEFLGKSIPLIRETQEAIIGRVLSVQKARQATCYFEFYGPSSFAGEHVATDSHVVSLLDIDVYKQGFISPESLLESFNGLPNLPPLIYYGQVTDDLIGQIKAGTLPGMTFEGVVCKAPAFKKWSLPVMFKIKNAAWIQKVTDKYGHNYVEFMEKI